MEIKGEEVEIKAVFHSEDGDGYSLIVGESAVTVKDSKGRTYLTIMGSDRDRIFKIKSEKKITDDVWLCKLEGASILVVRTSDPRAAINPMKLYQKYV